ncbi:MULTISPECIES: CdaR family transcriptional regulator [Streptomyces]|uniref:PucR family transcriptional regulator n=1 Tax=Streptomyces lycii TaxID=2654337 RepID=A0ABQ7FKI8_9ACTN|nr:MULTISPECIES: helix-turn-helix domain-containing protein [Streptomyces]KAF4408854.1 PucR family transcriptional regulator [Streptomyces lycii]PGH50321.1 regulator [Streptomyces sp. Ru87]
MTQQQTEQAQDDDYLEGYADILAEVSVTGRRLTRDELEARRLLGERAAEHAHGLRRLVAAHLGATRRAWPALPGTASAATTRELRAVADSVLAAVEQSVDAVAEGYERAQRLAVRQEEAARREFIDDLLYGRSDLGRLAERAERLGLRLAHEHLVAVADGPESYDETHPVARQVESALIARFGDRRILLTTKDGRIVCVAPGNQEDVVRHFAKHAHAATDGGKVAVGRTHSGPGGVVHSYEEALSALDLAERMELEGPMLRAADLLVFPVLTRDRQAMADLVISTLGPLERARGGAEPLLRTLSVYFDAGCVAAETARRLSLSVRALTYRLARIHELTGSDPADPMHRYALQTAVIGARLLDWPAREL